LAQEGGARVAPVGRGLVAASFRNRRDRQVARRTSIPCVGVWQGRFSRMPSLQPRRSPSSALLRCAGISARSLGAGFPRATIDRGLAHTLAERRIS
jgi:hypothetical protein